MMLSDLFGEQSAKSERGSVGREVGGCSHAQVLKGLSVPLARLVLQ